MKTLNQFVITVGVLLCSLAVWADDAKEKASLENFFSSRGTTYQEVLALAEANPELMDSVNTLYKNSFAVIDTVGGEYIFQGFITLDGVAPTLPKVDSLYISQDAAAYLGEAGVGQLKYQFKKERDYIKDETMKCSGGELILFGELPCRAEGINYAISGGMTYLVQKLMQGGDIDLTKCVLNSAVYFKSAARVMEGFQITDIYKQAKAKPLIYGESYQKALRLAELNTDMHDMLYFVSLKDNGTVRLNKNGKKDLANLTATFEYSKDRINWKEYTWSNTDNKTGAAITLTNAGDTVFFRALGAKKDGKNATMSYNGSTYYQFAFGANDSIAAGGNIMSLYDATCEQDTMTVYGFYYLFNGSKQLVSAPKLPATKVASNCYQSMFWNCKSLTTVHALPATTMVNECYSGMFMSCTSLTEAPELKATTLAKSCYSRMFRACTALTQAPELPADILAEGCYTMMFSTCYSLTQAPELPATTLAEGCYRNMFQGDTALIQAPELKATTLAEYCYSQMFLGCTKLEVDTFSVSCDGAELVVPDTTAAPTDWNMDMFKDCKGAYTNVKLGGHYCIKKFVPVIEGVSLTGFDDTYDGKAHAVQVSGTKEGDVIEFSGDSTTWKSTNPSFTHAGVDTLIYVRVQRTDYNDWGGNAKITITPKKIEADADAEDKDYDGTTTAEVYASLDGVISGDDVKLTATGTFADKNVGEGKTVTITFSISGKDAGNYILDEYSDTDEADIEAKKISVSGAYVSDKDYDGNTTANINDGELEDVISGDDVKLSVTGEFEDKNAGDGKEVTIYFTLSGTDAPNYYLQSESETHYPSIYPKEISVSETSVEGKIYDGNKTATVNAGTLNDVVAGDDITLSATGEFEDKNVGEGKTVTVNYTLSGTDAANYYLDDETEEEYADIEAKELHVSGTDVDDKTYDGTTTATVIPGDLDDVVKGDDVKLSATGTFADKNVGEGKEVTINFTLSGADAGNYVLDEYTTTDEADIEAKEIEVAGISVEHKTYDGNKTATVNGGTLEDVVAGDDVTFSATGEFEDKNVGYGKEVTINFTLSGADASNYKLKEETTTDVADIEAKELSVSETSVEGKIYDGNKTATVNAGTLNDVVAGDDVKLVATGEFVDKNVGDDNDVTIDYDLSGEDAGNYVLDKYAITVQAAITKRDITLQSADLEKEYDGTAITAYSKPEGTTITDLTAGQTDMGYVSGEEFNYSFTGSQLFVGNTDNTFTVSDSETALESNYNITKQFGELEVTKRTIPLTITANSDSKVYDGEALTNDGYETIGELAMNDELTVKVEGSITKVGTAANEVTYKIMHGDVDVTDQYANVTVENGTLQVTPRAIYVMNTTIADKVYDGNAEATVNEGTLSDVIAGDDVTVSATGEFDTKNVGDSKDVTVNYTISGADATNYNLIITSETLQANIAKREITLQSANLEKIFDNTALVGGGEITDLTAGQTDKGYVSGEEFNYSFTGSQLIVGESDNSFDVSDKGDALVSNYTVTKQYGTLTVKPATITGITLTGQDAVYSGEYYTLKVSGQLKSDVVSYSLDSIKWQTNKINVKKVGAYTIYVKVQRANYNDWVGSTTITISKRSLILTSASASKPYDGTPLTAKSVTISGDGLTKGEQLSYTYSGSQLLVGQSENTFDVSSTMTAKLENYDITKIYGELTVTNTDVAVTITTEGQTKEYDGTTNVAADKFSVSNLGAGDALNNVVLTSSSKNVGIYFNEIQVSSYAIMHNNGDGTYTDVTSYYTNISVEAGNLMIQPKSITMEGTTVAGKMYDGTRNAEATMGSISGVIPGDDVSVTISAANFDNKNAGTGKEVMVEYSVTGQDASNYAGPYDDFLTADITPRSITLTSASDSKYYDGYPLINEEVTESGDGWADGEGATYYVTGSQTEVGESANTFEYELNEGTLEMNYIINIVEGTLTVIQDVPTAVEDVQTESPRNEVVKFIKDNRIYIQINGILFDASGRRIE